MRSRGADRPEDGHDERRDPPAKSRRWGRARPENPAEEPVSGEELGWIADLRTAKQQRSNLGPGAADDAVPAPPMEEFPTGEHRGGRRAPEAGPPAGAPAEGRFRRSAETTAGQPVVPGGQQPVVPRSGNAPPAVPPPVADTPPQRPGPSPRYPNPASGGAHSADRDTTGSIPGPFHHSAPPSHPTPPSHSAPVPPSHSVPPSHPVPPPSVAGRVQPPQPGRVPPPGGAPAGRVPSPGPSPAAPAPAPEPPVPGRPDG
ncbi:hypothetical protein ACFQ4H_33805, partial [Micromonospora sonneratiae]